MSLLSINDCGGMPDPVARKKQRFDYAAAESDDITTQMTSFNGQAVMETQSCSKSREPEAINSFRESNSSASLFTKGDNQFNPIIVPNMDSGDVDNEESMDDITWSLDGDVISVVARPAKKPVIKQSNFTLPTIEEESDN